MRRRRGAPAYAGIGFFRSFGMILMEVSAPPSAVVPVKAFAEHLRLGAGFADDGSEDQVLELYLRAAMAAIEARIGRALLERTYAWTLTRWREEASQGLPIGPVRSVESVSLISADGVETEVPPDGWTLLREGHRPRLIGRDGRPLPRIPRGGQAEIRFTAGFGASWTAVPADLRQAVFLLAAHYYDNRAEPAQGSGCMPFGVLVLIEAYRTLRVGRGAA
jgi:uncharacterized phiE125 gp8 family phage protein